MTRLLELTPQWCDRFPVPRQPGVLYILRNLECASHLCPCGCGNQVITPLDGDSHPGWSLSTRDELVSLTPSVHCTGFACRSHYFIRDNKVEWC